LTIEFTRTQHCVLRLTFVNLDLCYLLRYRHFDHAKVFRNLPDSPTRVVRKY